MKIIDDRVTLLELDMFFMGKQSKIHPILIQDDNYQILIDAGLPGQFEQLENELLRAGSSAALLDYILLTHQDLDHIGCLPELAAVNSSVRICAHSLDAPYIRGENRLLKENVVPWQKQLEVWPSGRVDQLLSHDERLDSSGDIRVIHTPGHTDGHISLLLEDSRQLIIGDALFYLNGELQVPPQELTIDKSRAMESLEHLLEYEFDQILFYHGGVCPHGKQKLECLMGSRSQ